MVVINMVGNVVVSVPTGIKRGEPIAESIRKIDACVRNYGLERVFDRVREFKTYRWVGHMRLRENCECLACRLEAHLFKLMEKSFDDNEPIVIVGGEIPREAHLFTGREKFTPPKW